MKQQKAMAHYMTSIFGEKLYREKVDENAQTMPSPEQLKGRLLVKVNNMMIKQDFGQFNSIVNTITGT